MRGSSGKQLGAPQVQLHFLPWAWTVPASCCCKITGPTSMLRRLLKLNSSFIPDSMFLRSLQLLRLVAAPGLGKTTALLELWPKLYQLAQPVEGTEAGQEQDDLLYARIRRSMRPDCMMVFALDLQRTDLARLHYLEESLGSANPTILALRMLYSSVCQLGPWEDYGEFLEDMQPQLRASLRPMHVLHFWQAAAGVGDAEHWLAAFTLDEVGAAQPEPKPDQPSWLQHALANFVHLRQRGVPCRRSKDLENDGLAYIGQPGGPDLETGGSGDSTGRRASTDSDDVNDPGSTNPDAGEQQRCAV
ncbi:hypothetical protein WJX72_009136 [[Myrmecia] bisecta]|uniref:Uncharacterized protein n=1 Tax=[Myrmecia] bisecta TaxID=41462 RepID=A0AAW1PB20_9CHLO